MSVFEYGQAIAAAYEIFMEAAIAHDLDELREKGYRVMDIPLTKDPLALDKLLVLTNKEKNIVAGVSIILKGAEPSVMYHNALETKEYIRRIALAKGSTSPAAGKPLN
jgi:hypothetical protein